MCSSALRVGINDVDDVKQGKGVIGFIVLAKKRGIKRAFICNFRKNIIKIKITKIRN